MERRALGRSGLEVSVLGLGAGHLDGLDDPAAERLLHGALDLGLNLIDTAPGYGASEERIGRHLVGRREQVVLSTKGGYGVPGTPDWTAEVIVRGVEQALKVLRTDRLDVFHLHSCPLEVLQQGDLLGALDGVVSAGKVRVAAYSGENDALAWALTQPRFGVVQCSVNPFDQRALAALPSDGRVGVIGKRPLGNAPWRFAARPGGHYAECYWERWQAMQAARPELAAGLDWADVSLRFGAFSAGVSAVIVGTSRLEHLRENLRRVERGPLEPGLRTAIEQAFDGGDRAAQAAGQPGWIGQV